MDIRLSEVTLSNFRSYVQPTTIRFPESGLFLIQGASGPGNSTIPLAIAYANGYCPYPATELQSWLTDKPLSVKLVLHTSCNDGEGDNTLVISRGDAPEVTLNGKQLVKAASKINEKVQSVIKLSPELLAALTYRGQKGRGLFLSKTDSEKKEFLGQVLGLDEIEQAVSDSQERCKKLEVELGYCQRLLDVEKGRLYELGPEPPDFQAAIENKNKELAFLEDSYADAARQLSKQSIDVPQKYASRLEALKKSQSELQQYADDPALVANIGEIQRRIDKAMVADELRLGAVKTQIAALHAACSKAREAGHRESELRRKISEYEKILSGVCPTCNQAWAPNLQKVKQDHEAAKSELESVSEVAKTLPECLRSLRTAESEPFAPNPIINKLVQLKSSIEADLGAARRDYFASIGPKNREIQIEMDVIQEKIRQEIAEFNSSVHFILSAKEAKRQEKAVLEASQGVRVKWEESKARLSAVRTEVEKAEAEVAAVKSQIALEQEFVKMVGREGFLGVIFDEVLAEIAEEANSMLATVPNVSHVTIHFRSESQTLKGTVKKAIVPVVSVNGHEASIGSGLSGGMSTSVELAVDLAVSAVVSRRSGVVPGFLILDESFEGLGPGEKEAALEILKKHAANKLVIVVDHMPEFKEFFDKQLLVENQGGESKLTSL